MLIRAWDLRKFISGWLNKYSDGDFLLRGVHFLHGDWQHVRYLIVLLRPFFQCTEGLSTASSPIISKAWASYTGLFQHLERSDKLLRMKKRKWKSDLSSAVTAAHARLAEYYTKTDGHRGTIYNLACILDLMQKMELYKSSAF
jgi:hypothetical protein